MHRAGLALATAVLTIALGGCGGGGEDPTKEELLESSREQAKVLPIEVIGSPKSTDFTVPESVPPGLARIEFENNAQGNHAVQLIRLDEGHTPEEGLKAALPWFMEGKPLPDWVHPAGGVPITEERSTSTSVQSLEPGTYLVADTEAKGPPKVAATFVVSGERETALPDGSMVIEAFEYGFKAANLKRGTNEVLIDNTGDEPHFVEAVPMKQGKTLDDVKQFLKDEKGQPPVAFGKAVSTPVLEGGTRQLISLELESGPYALLCFVPDRAGGPPHAVQGMVSEAEVD
jgi:hypothetical protein